MNIVFSSDQIDSFETDDIAKIVKRINLIQIKNKLTKLEDEINKNLQPFLSSDKNSIESREALQVYITLMDEYPEVLTPDLIEPLSSLLSSDIDESRLDALILLGPFYLQK